MKLLNKITDYFSKFEIFLWCSSVVLIVTSSLLFGKDGILSLIASLIGVTSLILGAKGNPASQALMIIFSLLYGVISYSFAYYGEMMTYLGMSGPMALLALVSWLKNPYKGKRSQVAVNSITFKEVIFMLALAVAVTIAFYYILAYFNTANLAFSTLSITTSFIAVYLTFRRSPFFALAYAANDIVLIVLWVAAAFSDIAYISVVICFVVFLVNDLYGFYSWLKMGKSQKSND